MYTDLGWLHDDETNRLRQLAIHWRRGPSVCYADVHAIQLLSRLWSHCVSSIHPSKDNLVSNLLNSGLMSYVVVNGMIYLTKVISRGYIVPADEEHREFWTYKPAGAAPWFVRVVQDPKNIFGGKSVDDGQYETRSESNNYSTEQVNEAYAGKAHEAYAGKPNEAYAGKPNEAYAVKANDAYPGKAI
jgi:hypothetical protein